MNSIIETKMSGTLSLWRESTFQCSNCNRQDHGHIILSDEDLNTYPTPQFIKFATYHIKDICKFKTYLVSQCYCSPDAVARISDVCDGMKLYYDFPFIDKRLYIGFIKVTNFDQKIMNYGIVTTYGDTFPRELSLNYDICFDAQSDHCLFDECDITLSNDAVKIITCDTSKFTTIKINPNEHLYLTRVWFIHDIMCSWLD